MRSNHIYLMYGNCAESLHFISNLILVTLIFRAFVGYSKETKESEGNTEEMVEGVLASLKETVQNGYCAESHGKGTNIV